MGKKVLILSTSLRKNSNSNALAEEFARGAKDAGNTVELVSLRDKTVAFCKGCLSCQKTGRCVIHDDADEITQKMLNADVLVFATPVYYYGMSGQMKTMLDRANPLFSADYAFRDVYLLAAAAENDEDTADGTVKGLEGWVVCFEKARLAGVIFGGGATAPGEIQGNPAMKKAYETGTEV